MIGGFAKTSMAVRQLLADANFETVTPQEIKRVNRFYLQVELAKDLKVVVAPIEVAVGSGSRARPKRDWRVGIWVLQALTKPDSDAELEQEDLLTSFVDEIEEALIAKETVSIDDRNLSMQLTTDVPRTPMSAVAAMQHKAFLASLEVVINDQ